MYKPKEWIEYSMLRSGGVMVVVGVTVTVTVVLLAGVMITTSRRDGAGGVVAALDHVSLCHVSLCTAGAPTLD